MALTHLVDTSVLARVGRSGVREVIEPMAAAGSLARAGITDLELSCLVRGAREWDRVQGALAAFDLFETSADHMRRAMQVQRLLAAKRRSGTIPQLLVAAAAEARNLAVLHYDEGFDRIAAVTGQPVEWVVRSGTAD